MVMMVQRVKIESNLYGHDGVWFQQINLHYFELHIYTFYHDITDTYW